MDYEDKTDDLSHNLSDIGGGKNPHWRMDRQPPSKWADVCHLDYGPKEDFRVEDYFERVIIQPISEAAYQWLCHHLPEHVARYKSRSFIIDASDIEAVLNGMKRDKLMSYEEFIESMEEQHNLSLQGET